MFDKDINKLTLEEIDKMVEDYFNKTSKQELFIALVKAGFPLSMINMKYFIGGIFVTVKDTMEFLEVYSKRHHIPKLRVYKHACFEDVYIELERETSEQLAYNVFSKDNVKIGEIYVPTNLKTVVQKLNENYNKILLSEGPYDAQFVFEPILDITP